MNFRIADTFTDSLTKLTGDEQKAVKTTAFDLQMNPANPGMSFHKLDRAKDKNFWSVRVSRDIRLIVHKTDSSLLLCYVDHHDPAYRWAERRKLQTHPKTGAAQIVEVREVVEEIRVQKVVEEAAPAPAKPKLFTSLSEDQLLGFGVPPEWVDAVAVADEDQLLSLSEHLPSEASEILLEIATGGAVPQAPVPRPENESPFDHPDAQRRFRTIKDSDELALALDFPWDKWTIFLHPDQRDLVTKSFSGPARVAGSAGTGKTIVAIHRAAHLARENSDARVLLTTFSEPLAHALRRRLHRLLKPEPKLAERIDVHSMDSIALRLYQSRWGKPSIASDDVVMAALIQAKQDVGVDAFTDAFVWPEWRDIIDAWQLYSWDSYRNVTRAGRRTRISEQQRESLWQVFERVLAKLKQDEKLTLSQVYARVTEGIASNSSPFEFVVVDEAQDINVPQLRMLAAMAGETPDGLFFSGDLGQRIFQAAFSWKALGVDVRGRSKTLRVNYRTSHQIRRCADRLLDPEIADMDGNTESRKGTVSVFNGPDPVVTAFDSEDQEQGAVSQWIIDRMSDDGIAASEIAVFVRSPEQFDRAQSAVEAAGQAWHLLDERVDVQEGKVAIGSMHLAKGLEFRAVVVMACDDETIPLQSRIESIGDEADLQEVYATERHLFYVACTRARDFLRVTCVEPGSEFLEDLMS